MKSTVEVFNAPRHARRLAIEQLRNDRFELSLVPEHGASWIRLRLKVKGEWADFIRPYPDGDSLLDGKSGHGSFTMAPFSNRLAEGAFEFGGERFTLRRNGKDGTAIHGDARARPWTVSEAEAERFEASLDTREFPDFNFPFPLRFHQTLTLDGDCLRIEHSTENVGARPSPAGVGFHPYLLRRLTWRDDDVMVVLPADRVYPSAGCLPTGPAQPVEGATDLRSLRRFGAPNLDHCFTGLFTGSSEGLPERQIRIIYQGSRVEVRFTVDDSFGHAVVYAPNTPAGVPASFVAVEPVTNANNGFNLLAKGWEGTGVKVLRPGESWTAKWEISMGDI